MNKYLRTGLVVFAIVVFITAVAYPPANTAFQRLELQSEASTCRDVLAGDVDSLTAVYCEGVIREHDIMIKAYKEEQRRQLIERAQEKS